MTTKIDKYASHTPRNRELPARIERSIRIDPFNAYEVKVVFMPYTYTQFSRTLELSDLSPDKPHPIMFEIANWIDKGELPDGTQ